MTSKRSKRLKKCKTFALVDFEDGYEIVETKKMAGNIVENGKITVSWPGKGDVLGIVWALSNTKANLLEAKNNGDDSYFSDENTCNDEEQQAQKPKNSDSITKRKKPNSNSFVDSSTWTVCKAPESRIANLEQQQKHEE
uniref:Uncharacterized protein n=1 Tax=Romanomermis culicivorax TaxID=13658 RepID=A0A915KY25_ROMCU